ncbi:ABC transporter permease [Nonomuraea sp. NPDC051941]|uniref:ABC transporter permease n=1 Tax=Nonomuraea sp. NPDC051941 TaxID=3364373 RepID=UPI0037C7AD64
MSARAILLMIGKRLVALVVLIAILSFLVFSLVHIAPGTAVDAYLGGKPATPELVQALTERYHLDEPFLTQYWLWLQGALVFDFGESTLTTLPVTDEIAARLGPSAFLAVYAYLLTLILGVVPGIIAALRQRKMLDRGLVAGAVVALSTPPFVMGILLLYIFAVLVPIFPAAGLGEGFLDQLWHLTLPALGLALCVAAFLLRHSRASMINVLDQDYIMFARARGLSWRRVLVRYAFRNALIPVVTVSGALLAFFFAGAVFVETTFSLGGIGELLVQAAESSDMPMIQALAILIAVLIVLANLLADLAYMVIDPRIRFGGRSA